MATKQLFKMDKRPKDMTYGTYKATCAAKGMDAVDEDTFKALPVEGDEGEHAEPDGDEGQGGTGDGDGDEAGGQPAGDEQPKDDDNSEIGKALRAYGAVTSAAGNAGGSRETILKARLAAGTITKSEQAELGRIWAGTEKDTKVRGDGQPIRKALSEYLAEGDADLVDANPILKSLMDGVNDRLGEIGEQVTSDGKITRELVKAQGAVIVAAAREIAALRKSNTELEARLSVVERQPAQPRAVSTAAKGQPRGIAKSAAGDAAAPGDQLTKGQILSGLNQLVKSAYESGDKQTGSYFTNETARFEGGGQLSRPALAAVQALYK